MAYCVTFGLLAWAAILYYVFNLPGASVVCAGVVIAWHGAELLHAIYQAVRNG